MKKSFESLEINKVIEKIRVFIKTSSGLKRISNLTLSNERKYINREYRKLDEYLTLINHYNDLPLYSKINIKEEINLLKEGRLMDEYKLNLLKDEIITSIDLNKYFSKVKKEEININEIKELFTSIKPNLNLYSKIISSISTDNRVLDSASSELSRIRKEINNIDKRIHSLMNKYLSDYKDKLNGDNYVIRNGHLVLPINTNLKNQINGVIHDISDSGSTTFIEPYEIASLENEKNILSLKERDEITKILESFKRDILFDEYQLTLNSKCIGELDFLNAKYKYLKLNNLTIPSINEKPSFYFKKAKHPLLDKNVVVPNDFILGEEINNKSLILISGPNAGGKTIALKTIASLCYLTKLGLPLNVEEGSSSYVFNNIYVDIGDNQSIENNLSTFSSQVSNISYILKNVTSKDLVVFDELCNGTDPKEGEALAIAITKYLLSKKCLSAISSHYPLLKKFGIANEKILSASFVFDEKRIRPTFKMLLGVSGKSFGFSIANKFGIEETIVNDAKKIYEENYLSDEDRKIEVLEEKERELSYKEERLKNYEKSLQKEQSNIDKEKNKIKIRTEKLNQNKSEEFDRYLDEKYREINNIYKEFLENKNAKKALEKMAKINIEESGSEEIFVGDYVVIKSLDTKGEVSAIKGNKYTVITSEGFTVNTSFDSLKKIPKPQKVLKSEKNLDEAILNKKSAPSSINLLGYRAFEGVEAMENYISEAVVSGRNEIRVIHGFGTGRLKEALWEALKKNKNVASFKLGDETNGGNGSTIIKLK